MTEVIQMNQRETLENSSEELTVDRLLTVLRRARRAADQQIQALEEAARIASQIGEERDVNRDLIRALLQSEE